MHPIITYGAPPLIGALIGYLTNYVAIRMLFRPLKPWRIFGVRLPMTPGVIPGKRHELAVNIGKMVGGHLLTSSDVQKALAQESFRAELGSLLSSRVQTILAKDLGPLPTLIPGRFRGHFQAWVKVLRRRALKHLHAHLDSDRFGNNLQAVLRERIDELLERDLEEIIPADLRARIFAFLGETATGFLAGPEVERWLVAYLDNRLGELLAQGSTPADLLPADLASELLDLLEAETPGLLQKLAALIREPLMQERIAGALCRVVDSFTAALGPMAALLGSFLNPEAIHAKIRDYLDRKGEEISGWLFDEAVQAKVAEVLRSKAENLLQTPLTELLRKVPPEKLARARQVLAEKILRVLRDPASGRALVNLVNEALTAQQGRSLNEILLALLGPEGVGEARDAIGREVLSLVRSGNFKRVLDRLLSDLLEKHLLNRPIGRLDQFLPLEVRRGIDGFLLEQAGDILVREVPELVEALNIGETVTRKVDSLDLLKLEGLLLSIMEEQFKYINLFGGLLGFLIGLLNLLVLAWG
jgi:uncharacterized membrane protein YheB (UPF0754 family)